MASEKKAPRKAPTQERSKETVRILIEATSMCIARKGVAELSVAEVASTAGFNVASVYQYFPTKEALIAACEERALSTLAQTLITVATRAYEARAPLETSIPEIVCLALDLFDAHATTFALPTADESFSRKTERWEILERMSHVVAEMLAVRVEDEPRLANKDLRLAAQVTVHAVATLGYVGWVRQGNASNVSAFHREVGAMITRYLLS